MLYALLCYHDEAAEAAHIRLHLDRLIKESQPARRTSTEKVSRGCRDTAAPLFLEPKMPKIS
jgi:hypothetical protein